MEGLDGVYTQWMWGMLTGEILAGVRQTLAHLCTVLQPEAGGEAAGSGGGNADVAALAEGLQGALVLDKEKGGEERNVLAEMPLVNR